MILIFFSCGIIVYYDSCLSVENYSHISLQGIKCISSKLSFLLYLYLNFCMIFPSDCFSLYKAIQ